MTLQIAVIGGSGFVGRAVIENLSTRGAHPTAIPAPRLTSHPANAIDQWEREPQTVRRLAEKLALLT